MTPTLRLRTSTHRSRISSLAHAEFIQLRRNKTLIYMMVLPIIMGALYTVMAEEKTATIAGYLCDMITAFTLIFCAYYPVLSMTVTRRDEKVLKRLRIGENTDLDILASIALGPAISSLIIFALTCAFLPIMGFPLPDNIFLLLIAALFGVLLSCGLGFITAIFTRTAEAAQMTSMPLILLVFLSLGSIRSIYPDHVSKIVDYTPFAAVSDLIQQSWTGGDGYLQPIIVAILWTVVSCWAGARFMKWESTR